MKVLEKRLKLKGSKTESWKTFLSGNVEKKRKVHSFEERETICHPESKEKFTGIEFWRN